MGYTTRANNQYYYHHYHYHHYYYCYYYFYCHYIYIYHRFYRVMQDLDQMRRSQDVFPVLPLLWSIVEDPTFEA